MARSVPHLPTSKLVKIHNQFPHNDSEPAPICSLKDVFFKYPGSSKETPWLLGNPVHGGLNLSVIEGEKVGIHGDNGSGKSTITKLLLGIYKARKGRVSLFGKPVSWGMNYPEIGYIGDPGNSWEESGLPCYLTVGEMIHTVNKLVTNRDEGKAELLMDNLGLMPIWDKNVGTLSTGERKRVMAFLALSKTVTLLVLDEPLDGLDRDIKPFLMRTLEDISRNTPTTLLYIGHNRTELDLLTEKIYSLQEGLLIPQHQERFVVSLQYCNAEYHFRYKVGQIYDLVEVLLHKIRLTNSSFNLEVKPKRS